MKQKMLCFGNDFSIKDEQGQDKFFVDGKAFSFGQQLSFQDQHKQELAYIKQKLFTWRPTYLVLIGGDVIATVCKSLFSFRDTFTVKTQSGSNLKIIGRVIEHEYKVYRDREIAAKVSKRYFRMTDTYGVDILDGTDDLLVLCCAVAIDLMCHNK